MPVYQPSDDSYLLSETLEGYLINLTKKINELNKQITKNNKPNRLNFHKIINKKYKNQIKNNTLKILDMGSGSGIQAETCKKIGFKNILTIDINSEAIKFLKQKGFKTIKSNLFSKINPTQKFDLIIFNPPYLPEDKLEPIDSRTNTTAGKQGYEIIIKFLKQAKFHLEKNGKILLLFSNLSQPKIILNTAKKLDYNLVLLNKQKLFFEELFVYLISN